MSNPGQPRWQRNRSVHAAGLLARVPLFPFGLVALLGIGVTEWGPRWVSVSAWLWVMALGILFACWNLRGWSPLFGLLTVVTAAFGLKHRLQLDHLAAFPFSTALSAQPHGIPVVLEGIVAERPMKTGQMWRFQLKVESIQAGGTNGAWNGRILVRASNARPPAGIGQRVRVMGKMVEPELPRNPGEFDFRRWLFRQNILAEVQTGGAGVRILGDEPSWAWWRWIDGAREWLETTMTADVVDQTQAVAAIRAMVLGTREEMPEEVDLAFMHSGTVHVFSVSGLHVGLMALVIAALLSPLPLSPKFAAILAIPLVIGYALISGASAPAMRSAVMVSAVLIGTRVQVRAPNGSNSLWAAALILLAWDTQQVFQASFQLSFLVMLVIVGIQPWLMKPFRRFVEPDPFLPLELLEFKHTGWAWVKEALVVSMTSSLAATIGSLPLMLTHFQLVSPIAIVANFFLITQAAIVLWLAVASWLAALCQLTAVSLAFNHANVLMAKLCIWTASFFADLPGAWWRPQWGRGPEANSTRITVLDLQKGASSLIQPSDGSPWLCDTGAAKMAKHTTIEAVASRGVNRLGGLILTHGDASHISGTPEIIQTYKPRQLWLGAGEYRSPEWRKLFEIPAFATRITGKVGAETSLSLSPSAQLTGLFPTHQWRASRADSQCPVFRLESHGWRIMWMNDAGFSTEKVLLDMGSDLRCDILIKGHHTTEPSGLKELMLAAQPGLIIVTSDEVGAHERPSPEWRKSMEALGISVFNQAETGAVEIISSINELRADAFLGKSSWRRAK